MNAATAGPKGPASFFFLAALLLFAPLIRGGNRPMPLLILELTALAGLALLAWRQALPWKGLPLALRLAIAIFLAVPLLQLVPLPPAAWAALPGHDAYARALEIVGVAPRWRPVSLHPPATEYSWLVMLPCLGVFLLALTQDRDGVVKLVRIMVLMALFQAALGLMQLGASKGSWLVFGNPYGGGVPTGTYVNRNHFAALMAMVLPMAIALWTMENVTPRGRDGARLKAHPRHADRRIARNIVLSLLMLLMMTALIMTSSRGGIGSGFLALSLAALLLVWRSRSLAARIGFGALALLALGFAAYIGLTPVLERFSSVQLAEGYEGRARIAASAFQAGLQFLPFGSGLGTFGDMFRRYQADSPSVYFDHAHNDYVELFVELGVAGVVAAALALAAYARRWGQLLRQGGERGLERIQLAAGLGMLAMLAHGFSDFNFHIPANAIYFSFLAGVFFLTPASDRA